MSTVRRTSRLNNSWIIAGIGVVIVLMSVALMAYSAPSRSAPPIRQAPAPHGRVILQREPGPIPGPGGWSKLRPAR